MNRNDAGTPYDRHDEDFAPLGHLARRIARGNTGASDVSAFAPMAVSAEVEQLLSDKEM
jgi:hypothetical protein